MTICIIDTSVFCGIVDVPSMCNDPKAVFAELEAKARGEEHLMLPMATILETGNHVAQNGDGGARRSTAQRFVSLVKGAIEGNTPFTATRFLEREELLEWLAEFPDWAGRTVGLGDLSIIKEWEHQRALHPKRRVYIWSIDGDLQGYDTGPP